MREANINASFFTYGVAMQAAVVGEQWAEVLEIYRTVRAGPEIPNYFVLDYALAACGKLEDWDWALLVLEDMHKYASPPKPVHLRMEPLRKACEKPMNQHLVPCQLLKEGRFMDIGRSRQDAAPVPLRVVV